MMTDIFLNLFEEGEWALNKVSPYLNGGWSSVIGHKCYNNEGSYYTLLRKHTQPNECRQCCAVMPDSIVTLFKFHNWENMK